MPKSRRDRKVSLTQTKKKGLEHKQKLVEDLRACVDTYSYLYTFSVCNMRNSKLKDVRTAWKHSRFFFGKNKVMILALGKGVRDEYREGLHKVGQRLHGEVGLLFSNWDSDKVTKWFAEFSQVDFARCGALAPMDVVLDAGPLDKFPHSMEPQLRQLGLPTSLQRGVVHLLRDFTLCKEGDSLTPEQARLLKLCSVPLCEFRVSVDSVWSAATGQCLPLVMVVMVSERCLAHAVGILAIKNHHQSSSSSSSSTSSSSTSSP
ncbi:mRNA turnover protein 4 homolog isoform X2 [Lampetra fluviatilis]